jgi:parallel beta-helix repeat protein
LDSQNEWYYNPSTKKILLYSSSTPSNIKVATVDNLINVNGYNYITFDGLAFIGSNNSLVQITNATYVTLQNCNIDYSGKDAINGNGMGPSTGLTVKNCSINHSNNYGISLRNTFNYATIQSNTISNTGWVPGMSGITAMGIDAQGNNTLVSYNTVQNTAYAGIQYFGDQTTVSNNFVKDFCVYLKDGGGIYTWNGHGGTVKSNIKITNNIVINDLNSDMDVGIYLDDWSNNIEVSGNTVSGCGWGLSAGNAFDAKFLNNTSYNNSMASLFLLTSPTEPVPGKTGMTNLEIKGNIFFTASVAQVGAQKTMFIMNAASGAQLPGSVIFDYNYYVRPFDYSKGSIYSYFNSTGADRTLANWKAFSGQDAHSQETPKIITDPKDLRFEYNATTSSKTINLGASYIDAKGTSYNGTITLAPFTSAVLIKTGLATNNQVPTAKAGNNQTITLPSTTVTLSGSGQDADGTISSYKWTKVSGPASGTITSPTSSSTTVTSLVEGIYQFQLQVTDNLGAIGTATVQVTVVKASISVNLLPAVNPANVEYGLDYSYYESSNGYTGVPAFSGLTPVKTGTSNDIDLSLANRSTQYAFNFTGYVSVPEDGQYTFYTASDDGSTLYIDNVLVTNNDGLHAANERSGIIGLKAGKHTISVGYIQQGGDATLLVSYSGPGVSKQPIPGASLFRESLSNAIVSNELLPAVNPANVVYGLDYSYYQSSNGYGAVPSFSGLTPVKTGTTENFDLSLAQRSTQYAFNFTGYIGVPTDGQYTFYTNSDDGSKLYIDNVLVTNNDGLHAANERSGIIGLKAGKHTISVGYIQQSGDATLSVSYSGPGVSKQVIPKYSLYRVPSDGLLPAVNPANTINGGLDYKYYERMENYSSVPTFSSLTPVKTGTSSNFDISVATKSTSFAFSFTGYINVPTDGQYNFYTTSDDGSTLYIDNVLVTNNDGLHGAIERSGTIGLKAGKHAISVGYLQQGGDATLSINYSGPGISKQSIPSSFLYRVSTTASRNSFAPTAPNINAPTANATAISDSLSTDLGRNLPTNLSILELSIKAYPNPFVNSLIVNITGGGTGNYKLLLVDALGRTLMTKTNVKNAPTVQETINTSSLRKGIYFLRIILNDTNKVVKLEK